MRYVVESYMQQASGDALADVETAAQAAASALTTDGEWIEHVRSTFVSDDEMCFHVFDAGSPNTVARASIAAGLDPIRIVTALETGLTDKTPTR